MGVAPYRLYASALAALVPVTAGEPPPEAGARSKRPRHSTNAMRAVKPRVATGPSEEPSGTGVSGTCRAEAPSGAIRHLGGIGAAWRSRRPVRALPH